MGSFTNWQTYLQYACTCTVCWIIRNQLFWWTAIAWMSISFSMTDLPQESHGAVLDPQILSCSHIFRSRSRTSSGCPPAWTVSPQNRHTIKRKGQVEDWCWTYHRRTNQVRIVWLKNRWNIQKEVHTIRNEWKNIIYASWLLKIDLCWKYKMQYPMIELRGVDWKHTVYAKFNKKGAFKDRCTPKSACVTTS
jgi:hypothetical protein